MAASPLNPSMKSWVVIDRKPIPGVFSASGMAEMQGDWLVACDDIDAACGQLAGQVKDKTKRTAGRVIPLMEARS
jgi:hypothetical protein